MKVAIDSDATGRNMRRSILAWLGWAKYAITDLNSADGDQYPDIAIRLAKRIASGEFERGVLICGTGLGMAMAANKVRGVFAGTPHDMVSAKKMAESNNAQIITIGCELEYPDDVIAMVVTFLSAKFQPRANALRMRELELQQ